MKERLQKILSGRGIASRRHAEEMIQAGRVTCNGEIARLGDSADPETDIIELDGKPLPAQNQFTYIMLNKPRGYVTTLSDEKGRANAAQLVAECGQRVYPVGRLDMDSEGLLLFTNDGELANKLMHPSHEINKTYRVSVKEYSAEKLDRLKQPIVLDGYRIQPPQIRLTHPPRNENDTAILQVTIHEGRNRQVRRMCAAAGMKVSRLIRIAEGNLRIGQLPSGQWRYLSEAEVMELKK